MPVLIFFLQAADGTFRTDLAFGRVHFHAPWSSAARKASTKLIPNYVTVKI
jgi:hypothetical protein